jgi:predicted MFS family arabinose efflux permease
MSRPSTTTLRLLVLASATFVFVTTETQPVALLSPMARGLSVSEATIGLLMTVYAAAAALSTIPLTSLASRVSRRRLLCATVATLVVSQLALALAPDYGVALGARLIGALAHGVFWSVLAQVAAGLVPRDRVGRATAITYAGNSVALVAGTPLVSALGALVGWRAAVSVMGVIALAIVVAMAHVLPEIDSSAAAGGRRALLGEALRHRGVALVCATTLLLAFGQFLAFTYLAPLVRAHTGLTGTGLSVVLFAYGAAGVLGVARVAALADRSPRTAMLACCALIVAGLALIVAIPHGTVAMVAAVVAWGAGFTGLPICLQSAVLRVAPTLPDTASSLYVSAFQVGIGGGSLAGSALLGAGRLAVIPAGALGLFVAGSVIAAAARATFGGDAAPESPHHDIRRTPEPEARTARRRSLRPPSAARARRSRVSDRPRARR